MRRFLEEVKYDNFPCKICKDTGMEPESSHSLHSLGPRPWFECSPSSPPLPPTGPTICLRYRSTPLFWQEVKLVGLSSWWAHELKLARCKESEVFTTINVQRSDDWSRVPLLILHLDTGNLMNTALSALSLDIQIDWAGGPGLAEGIFICLGNHALGSLSNFTQMESGPRVTESRMSDRCVSD